MRRMMTEKEIATVESLRKDGITSLKDAQGNPRFVEGDITMETIEGVTQTYGKWSLSGTHLMIVLIYDIATNVTTPVNASLAKFSLPDYIYSKIPMVWGNAVNVINVTSRNKSAWYTTQTLQSIQLYKLNNPSKEMEIRTSSSTITTTAESACRIQFDLVIDTDYDD